MINWLLKKYYKDCPVCKCGWVMKPFDTWTGYFQWKCIWKKCRWELFTEDNINMHWFKRK